MGLSSQQLATQLVEQVRTEVRAEVRAELYRVLEQQRRPVPIRDADVPPVAAEPAVEAPKVDGRKKPRTAKQIRAAKANIKKAREARAAKVSGKSKKKRKSA